MTVKRFIITVSFSVNIISAISAVVLITGSCIKMPKYDPSDQQEENNGGSGNNNEVGVDSVYMYPFGSGIQIVNADIYLTVPGAPAEDVSASVPPLKYNKQWLFLLTQDDCKHAAFSCTWAAINGRPLSDRYYYDIAHLEAGDIPPDAYYLGKTLGSTDGAGNEVRFTFSTTISPEWSWMDAETNVKKGFIENFYRFYMKSGLTWANIRYMLNYGTGIGFHDMNTKDVNNTDTLVKHYRIAQSITKQKLGGRGVKFLAEPNGNKTYITAARIYDSLQIYTASSGAEVIYPYNVSGDITGKLVNRNFYNTENDIKSDVAKIMAMPLESRPALSMGIHGTNGAFASFLMWINDNFGKNGDDSVWFTSLEEYYEYIYFRSHAAITKSVSTNLNSVTYHFSITLPVGRSFFFPSFTLNINGLSAEQIESVLTDPSVSVSASESVKGLSLARYTAPSAGQEPGKQCVMLNIDCSRYLPEMAEHFTVVYEKSVLNKDLDAALVKAAYDDALYFTGKLKYSSVKSSLLQRLQK